MNDANTDVRVAHVTTVAMSLGFLRGQPGFMKARGMQLFAISSPGVEMEAFGRAEQVPVFDVPMVRRIAPLVDLMAAWRLLRVLRAIGPDIVHGHTPKGGLLSMMAALVARAPIRVYHMRGLPFMTASGARRWVLKAVERVTCSLAHQVYCVSPSLKAVAVREGVATEAKVLVLAGGSGNGVDAETRFNPHRLAPDQGLVTRAKHGIPKDARVLGFIGRLVRDKGVRELVEAWEKLAEEFPDLRLLVIGPFEAQDPLDEVTIGRLQNDSRVHLTGLDWDTPPYYAAMDVLVLPTYREGFPNVPLEAAAMEVPVVATRIPGCVDAVEDGVTGTLVPPQDVASLVAAIRAYLLDPSLAARHGLAGRSRVLSRFSQLAVWQALYDDYSRLLEVRGRRSRFANRA